MELSEFERFIVGQHPELVPVRVHCRLLADGNTEFRFFLKFGNLPQMEKMVVGQVAEIAAALKALGCLGLFAY
jgi:hypothetical protein